MGIGEELDKRKVEFARLVVRWARHNLRDFPWRETGDPYKVFVAEALLKRTTSTAVERVFQEFLDSFPDITSLESSELQKIESVLRPIGLYKQRSRGLKEAAGYIVANYGGRLPSSYRELLSVPHVGPYAAGAILSFGFGKPAPIVDSNVRRVVGSVFRDVLGPSPSDREVRGLLEGALPEEDHRHFNLGLLDLGATVCTYREKKCGQCPLNQVCYSSQ